MSIFSEITLGAKIAWGLTAIFMVVVGLLTLTPVPDRVVPVGSDKIYHMVAFAFLTLPLSIAYPRFVVRLVVLFSAYGFAIEVIQPYVGRAFEFYDFVADAAGCILASILGCLIAQRTKFLKFRPE